jgi:hypothetical protein
MLYYQWSILSKTQEAEKMGKKTVHIAGQRTQERKVFITHRDRDTNANHVVNSSRINHNKSV